MASGGFMGVVGSGHVVRNNQLPPLEIGGGTTGIPIPTGMEPTFTYIACCHFGPLSLYVFLVGQGGTCPLFFLSPLKVQITECIVRKYSLG